MQIFLKARDAKNMTVRLARYFVKHIRSSNNPTISRFNYGVKAEMYAAGIYGENGLAHVAYFMLLGFDGQARRANTAVEVECNRTITGRRHYGRFNGRKRRHA